ncbi:hypothetical protein Trydic_g13113 [Trypoxylus dichotomus]
MESKLALGVGCISLATPISTSSKPQPPIFICLIVLVEVEVSHLYSAYLIPVFDSKRNILNCGLLWQNAMP